MCFCQLLGDVEDMVANAFKIGEQFRVKNARFIGTRSVSHPNQLIALEFGGHVINLLLQLGHMGKPFLLPRIGRKQGGHGTDGDIPHLVDLLPSELGK